MTHCERCRRRPRTPRKLNKHIAGSRLVELEGGGHMPILEFKDEVNQAIDDLLTAADDHRRVAS